MIKADNLSDPGAFRDDLGFFIGPRIHYSGLWLLKIFRESQKLEQRTDYLTLLLLSEVGRRSLLPLRPSFSEDALPLECGQWKVNS